jgi:hypothetical protein
VGRWDQESPGWEKLGYLLRKHEIQEYKKHEKNRKFFSIAILLILQRTTKN